jgi:hypothetical protein
MKEFTLLIRGERMKEDAAPEEYQKHVEKYYGWINGLIKDGYLIDARPLSPNGKRVSGKGGENVMDGPFIESKEDVGGYFLIRAKDLEEATQIARGCPALESGGIVEVRPVNEGILAVLKGKLGPGFNP